MAERQIGHWASSLVISVRFPVVKRRSRSVAKSAHHYIVYANGRNECYILYRRFDRDISWSFTLNTHRVTGLLLMLCSQTLKQAITSS